MKNLIYTCILLISSISLALDFSEGPYGSEYFNIAGPLELEDLNALPKGDVNDDGVLNIQDVIMIIQYVIGNITNPSWIDIGDVNNDNIIDILDIVTTLNSILSGSEPIWDFETEWNGEDCYIFINYTTSSGTLLASSTKELLLSNSPMNVHYFFISDRTTYTTDIQNLKNTFDEILDGLSIDLKDHWNTHLHFVPQRTGALNNWLEEALAGEDAIAIDRFQRIRETGYFGNPASFQGTYIHYLAHEAIYYNYEFDTIYEPDEDYDEFVVLDEAYYTGGWAASISEIVNFPSDEELNQYSGMSIELLRGCPDSNMNYSDEGCDDYDRIAHMYICEIDGSDCYEAARWITPFDRQPHHLTNISPFISLIRPGGEKMIKFQESGWPNSIISLKFRLYRDSSIDLTETAQEIVPIWNGTVGFNPDYDDNRPLNVFQVPSNATKVEFVSYITGHGWGCDSYNCAEFCNSRHTFELNGGTYEFSKDHPNASSSNYCMSLEAIAAGTIPNQYGTWGYGRAGWCPGQDVTPHIVDITENIIIGEENIIDYGACRVSGNNCYTPPTCPGNGCYCAEIAMSSYIIIYY